MKTILLYFSLFIIASCDKTNCKHDSDLHDFEYFSNGNLKSDLQVINGLKNGKCFYYYNDGNLKSINSYKNDTLDGESLIFYTNGRVEQKINYVKGEPNGISYNYFESGVNQYDRPWSDGKKIGYGVDYYDTISAIKSVLIYDSSGILIYKENFDRVGKLIGTEGKNPFKNGKSLVN